MLLLAAGPVCAASICAASCGDTAGNPAATGPVHEGGSETSAADVGLDDSSIRVDAADAGENPFPGVWNAVPGTPPYCKYVMAADPAALRSKWIPCSSGRAGCRVLDSSWSARPGQRIYASRGSDPARVVNGKAILRIQRLFPYMLPDPYYAYYDVIEPLDGDPVLAIGAGPTWGTNGRPNVCSLLAFFGDHGVGFGAWPRDYSISTDSDEFIWGWAPWSSPSTLTTHVTKRSEWHAGGSAFFLDGTMGQNRIWLTIDNPRTTGWFDLSTKKAKLASGEIFSERPLAVPGGAVTFDANSPYAIAFVSDDGAVARLVTPTSPQFVTWKTLDRSNGDTLVWVESEYGLGYVNSTIWAAPLVASEATLARKKVAKLEDALQRGGARGVANRGVFVNLVGRNMALVTRLSDGMGWLVQGEPKQRFVDPVWVDDDDVLIETAPDPDGSRDEGATSILRLSRSSLGSPTVPSGL